MLSRLVNFRISEGVVPKAWKQAIITPVPKTALVSTVNDLQPISITPILSRIVEQLVVSDYLISCIPRENLVDKYTYKATSRHKLPLLDHFRFRHAPFSPPSWSKE